VYWTSEKSVLKEMILKQESVMERNGARIAEVPAENTHTHVQTM